jgi:hypothetical protein
MNDYELDIRLIPWFVGSILVVTIVGTIAVCYLFGCK